LEVEHLNDDKGIHIYRVLDCNQLEGSLPSSLRNLNNLKRL